MARAPEDPIPTAVVSFQTNQTVQQTIHINIIKINKLKSTELYKDFNKIVTGIQRQQIQRGFQ